MRRDNALPGLLALGLRRLMSRNAGCQQYVRVDPEGLRKLLQRIDRGRAFLTLDHAGVVAIDASQFRQLFLRVAACKPQRPEILRDDLSEPHAMTDSPNRRLIDLL